MDNHTPAETYKAALLIIGNEILVGRTQDTNTPWMAGRLVEHGVLLDEVRIVPDVEDVIANTVNELRSKFDYVFTTGGLGPTHDDITAQSIAKAFGVKLVQNEDAYRALEEHYGIEELTPPRLKMAQAPEGAQLIPNPVTAAPGFIMENVYVMAGVPRIMQAMFDHVLGMINSGKPILSKTIACNLAESTIAEDLEKLQRQYPNIQMGSYPHYRGGILGLSLVLRGTDDDELNEAVGQLIEIITSHGAEPKALSLEN